MCARADVACYDMCTCASTCVYGSFLPVNRAAAAWETRLGPLCGTCTVRLQVIRMMSEWLVSTKRRFDGFRNLTPVIGRDEGVSPENLYESRRVVFLAGGRY